VEKNIICMIYLIPSKMMNISRNMPLFFYLHIDVVGEFKVKFLCMEVSVIIWCYSGNVVRTKKTTSWGFHSYSCSLVIGPWSKMAIFGNFSRKKPWILFGLKTWGKLRIQAILSMRLLNPITSSNGNQYLHLL